MGSSTGTPYHRLYFPDVQVATDLGLVAGAQASLLEGEAGNQTLRKKQVDTLSEHYQGRLQPHCRGHVVDPSHNPQECGAYVPWVSPSNKGVYCSNFGTYLSTSCMRAVTGPVHGPMATTVSANTKRQTTCKAHTRRPNGRNSLGVSTQ